MNNFNGNAAQQVGDNSQSLMRVHSKEEKLSSTAQIVVNKEKYSNKQLAAQELAKPNQRNILVMEGFKCIVCGSQTYMHMDMIPCMTRAHMTTAPCMALQNRRTNLCCVHCNLEFENEQQVLQHGHIIKFKSKHKIKEN